MEPELLDSLRAELLNRRSELQQLQADSKSSAGTVSLDQSRVGRLSRMDALQAQQMAKETERRRQTELMKIESALGRLDSGDYGYCFKCGEEIALPRLRFDPASTRCMACMDQ